MGVWSEIVGQDDAVTMLQRAAADRGGEGGSMTHSWLITGPPGSGRSNLAFAFATALLSPPDAEDAAVAKLVAARTHPDLIVLSTDGIIIDIKSAREAVKRSYYAPSNGRYRVVVVEDADRMTEHTSNTLLKALEEPPDQTVWILCAPSEADLLPTIRSRVRTVSLSVPGIAEVAALLVARDGVDAAVAQVVARESQSHIGMARRLATSDEARARRAETLDVASRVRSAGHAVLAATRFVEIAGSDSESLTAEMDAAEREQALRQLGVAPGGAVPAGVRSSIKALEDAQKKRSKRGLRDGVDRILVDLMSLFRDVLLVQLGVGHDLVNEAIRQRIEEIAAAGRPEGTLRVLDDIMLARRRIAANVPPQLALEAMLVTISRLGARRDVR